MEFVCDNRMDCRNGEDEYNCGKMFLNVKVDKSDSYQIDHSIKSVGVNLPSHLNHKNTDSSRYDLAYSKVYLAGNYRQQKSESLRDVRLNN